MNPPTDEQINDTLRQLERTRMEIVDEWMSDAAKQGLPVVNVHDTRGAKVLDTDAVVRGSYPNHARRE